MLIPPSIITFRSPSRMLAALLSAAAIAQAQPAVQGAGSGEGICE